MAFLVTVTDNATGRLQQLHAAYEDARLKPLLGRAVTNVVREHLFAKDRSSPNKLGGKRTHFYGQAARSTHFQVTADGADVIISHVGIRQRFQGGEVRPVKAKVLTIPLTAEAHGKRAREFDGLVFVKASRGEKANAFLARKSDLENDVFKPLFLLTHKTTHKPDPSVIPDRSQINHAVKETLAEALKFL